MMRYLVYMIVEIWCDLLNFMVLNGNVNRFLDVGWELNWDIRLLYGR